MLFRIRLPQMLLAASALVAASGAAHADDAAKATFSARYEALQGAMTAHDGAGVRAILTPDFEATDINGETHDGAALIERAARMPAGASRQVSTTVLSATVSGSAAAVEQQLNGSMTRTGPDGAQHQLEMVVVSDDTWTNVGGTWLLQKSVQKDVTVKRDGETMFHQGS